MFVKVTVLPKIITLPVTKNAESTSMPLAKVAVGSDIQTMLRRQDQVLSELKRLQTNRNTQKEEQKAAAMQRISEIKAKLQHLRSLLQTGNPQSNARLLKQLATELAAAVKMYAAAGGGGAQGGDVTTPPLGSDTADAGNSGIVASETQNEEKNIAEILRPITDQKSDTDSKKADAEFMSEARKLASQLKALSKQQSHMMSHNKRVDTDNVQDKLKEIEQLLQDIDSGSFTDLPEISIRV